jgi:hypothetical protein
VVWIAAGPGAGKSTLAAAWSAGRPGNVLWYRVDEGDADPGTTFSMFTLLAKGHRRKIVLPVYRSHEVEADFRRVPTAFDMKN